MYSVASSPGLMGYWEGIDEVEHLTNVD